MDPFVAIVIIILSIILHEVSHGYAADALGDPTPRLAGRLTLNPLKHIDVVGSLLVPGLLVLSNSPMLFGWAKPVPYNPFNLRGGRFGEAFVAAAGSLTNLVIGVLFALVVRYGSVLGFDLNALKVALIIAFTNIFLGLFNLIPFPPLDGFTTLRALVPFTASRSLERFELSLRGAGLVSLILFLYFFSLIFSLPFYNLVVYLTSLLTGG